MFQALLSWLVLLAPLVLAVCATAMAWRRVTKPFLFLFVAVLALVAIQAVGLLLMAELLPPSEPDETYMQMGMFVAALAVAIGCPMLWFLYRALRHGSASVEGA